MAPFRGCCYCGGELKKRQRIVWLLGNAGAHRRCFDEHKKKRQAIYDAAMEDERKKWAPVRVPPL